MKLLLLGTFCLLFSSVNAQNYWTKQDQSSVTQSKRNVDNLPNKFQIFELQTEIFKALAAEAPKRGANSDVDGVELFFPMADGSLKAFRVYEAPVLDEDLSDRFPSIKSYAAQGIENPSEVMRFSISHKGLKGMLFSSDGYEFIEPYTEDRSHYMVYKRSDRYQGHEPLACSVMESAKKKIHQHNERDNADDGTLRNYRLAVSTNGEYTIYHGGTVADALAAINTSMTRVNGIFEIDFNVTMTLISETTDVIYTNPNTDPYGSSNGWNNQLQSTLTAEIGEANYDIGHLFAQGGNSGNAGCIGCVCVNNDKGSGWTSRSVPEGDPFDVDYVAHEMGHQFGGNHTWTHGGNEGTNVQMEPGSGSTIMGYAGITGPTDVQPNSDPYFHAVSIEQITDYIKVTTCQIDITTGNAVPTVNAGLNKTIPRGTPFTLSGVANDTDGDALTYCWEQMDENNASTTYPSTTATTGVAFRSFNPTTSPDRTFPAIGTVLNGSTASTWEVIPEVGRSLNFRLTVRDNVAGGGTNESDNLLLTVHGNSGPFIVNTANTPTTYLETDIVTIDWDVANTDVAPVSCSEVDILLSYDGGLTYPVTLLTNTANDGTADITLPLGLTTQGRFMVKCSDNYFFDINDADFTIEEGSPTYTLATNPTSAEICNSENTYSFVLESNSVQGYNTPITLVLSGLPAGAAGSFTTNPLTPGQNTTVQLTGLSGTVGTSQITINGSSGIIAKDAMLDLTLAPQPNAPSLSTPANNETDVDPTTTLTWSVVTGAGNYEYRIGLTAGASDAETGVVASNSVTLSNELASDTDHFWAVRSLSTAGCAPSAWSPTFTFRTKVCKTFTATDLPIAISSSGTPTITSDITIRDRGTVNDLNLVSLIGTHSYVDDLIMSIIAPDNAETIVWNRPCGSQDNFDINLDDDVPAGSWPCPPIDGGTYRPSNALSFYDNKSIKGTWTLEVFDRANQDGGSLNSYGYYMCLDDYCDLTVDKETYLGGGSLSRAIACAVPGDTIYLESSIPNQIIDIGNNVININIDDLTIIAEAPITLRAANFTQTMFIGPSADVTLIGFSVENTAGIGIVNTGTLTLQDISVYSDGGAEQVYNAGSGSLTVKGQCNLEVED